MVELNIEETEVLRRVLNDMDSKLQKLEGGKSILPLDDGATTEQIITKINELIFNVNLILK